MRQTWRASPISYVTYCDDTPVGELLQPQELWRVFRTTTIATTPDVRGIACGRS